MANPLFDWDAWRQQARASTEGLNNLPGVFSDYAGLATKSPQEVKEAFYPRSAPSLKTPKALLQEVFADPLFAGYLSQPGAKRNLTENPEQIPIIRQMLLEQAQAQPQAQPQTPGNPVMQTGFTPFQPLENPYQETVNPLFYSFGP